MNYRPPKMLLLKVCGTLFLIVLTTFVFFCFIFSLYIKNIILPQAEISLTSFSPKLSTTLYYKTDSDWNEYERLFSSENRIWIEYSEIPQDLINATVAIEDKRFWTHHGVDWIRTVKGGISMFTGGQIEGGSTITQQLIKNMTQKDEVTVKRKLLEIFRALNLEQKYTKETILEYYLNYIYFGHQNYGIASASSYYFGKDVRDLTLEECAILISITNNPSLYDPYTQTDNLSNRAHLVLDLLLEQEQITEKEYNEAVAALENIDTIITYDPQTKTSASDGIYSWYTETVITEVIQDLMDCYNYTERVATDLVYSGGLSIYTNVDAEIQTMVDNVYLKESLSLKSKSGQEIQSAIVIINPEGRVVAIAGQLGEKKQNRIFNMATSAHRQPGSSIKPLSVYSPALEKNLITSFSTYDDYPIINDGNVWPHNAYGYYNGMTSIKEAVATSSNAVAVRVLNDVGITNSHAFIQNNFHFSNASILPEDIGLAQLALGGLTNGVTPWEMAAAYSVFPRGGVYIEPTTYSQVKDSNGNVILDKSNRTNELAISDKTAWYINELLEEVVLNGTGVGASIDGIVTAGKTGTTDNNYDKWFVGYTPYYTAAVWVGYETPEKIASSTNPAIQLWKQVMTPVHEGLAEKNYFTQLDTTTVTICKDSGMKATEACELDPRGSRLEYVMCPSEDVPSEYCSIHETVNGCADNPVLLDGRMVEGLYYANNEFCPNQIQFSLLNINRTNLPSISSKDSVYTIQNWKMMGVCTLHNDSVVFESGDNAESEEDEMTDINEKGDIFNDQIDEIAD